MARRRLNGMAEWFKALGERPAMLSTTDQMPRQAAGEPPLATARLWPMPASRLTIPIPLQQNLEPIAGTLSFCVIEAGFLEGRGVDLVDDAPERFAS